MLRRGKGREGGGGFGRCYVAAWCQRTVRLGKEVCVHIPDFPTAVAEEGGAGRQEKRGDMNGKTASEEATETCTRDIFPIYHSSS